MNSVLKNIRFSLKFQNDLKKLKNSSFKKNLKNILFSCIQLDFKIFMHILYKKIKIALSSYFKKYKKNQLMIITISLRLFIRI
jgi:hypothetical protein